MRPQNIGSRKQSNSMQPLCLQPLCLGPDYITFPVLQVQGHATTKQNILPPRHFKSSRKSGTCAWNAMQGALLLRLSKIAPAQQSKLPHGETHHADNAVQRYSRVCDTNHANGQRHAVHGKICCAAAATPSALVLHSVKPPAARLP
jgi:hypothetical protein